MVFCVRFLLLSLMFSRVFHPGACISISCAKTLWLNNIQLCGYTHSVYFGFHSTVDGHLGYFLSFSYCEWCHSEHACTSFVWKSVFNMGGIKLGVELLDLRLILRFNFLEQPNFFLTAGHHFTFPPTVYDGSNFSISSSTLVIFQFKKKL